MATRRILIRRDTAANWTSANPVLAQGELGGETNTGKLKLGDGSTAWNSLAYLGGVTSVNGQTGMVTGVVTTSDTGTVTSAMLADGTITNADINASAGIALSKLASGTSAQMMVVNSSGVPTYRTISGDITISDTGVATLAANSVVMGSDTSGSYVANLVAGTGVTLSNNTGSGATPTVAIGQAVGTTSEVTFAGIKSTSVIEPLTISATAATGTIIVDAANGTTYYTTNASANWVVNLRWNSGTTLDSKLATGEMTTTSFLAKQGGTAYYPTSIQVNGTTSGVTARWQGSTGAPTSGNANSIDMYTFTVVKTASATFEVFAAQTRFA